MGQSGDTTFDHHVDNIDDFDVDDDDLLNDEQLNAAWRRAGGLDHALLDDYVDPDQGESSAAPAAAAAPAAPAAAAAVAAPAADTAAAAVAAPPLADGTAASPIAEQAANAAEPPIAGLAPDLIDDDDLGAPIGLTPAAMRQRIAANNAARPATPGAAGLQVTAYTTWRERALGISTIPSPLQPDGQPSLIGMSHISSGEGLDECPWPCPTHGVKQQGSSFTEIVRAHIDVFGANGIDEPLLARLRSEVSKDVPLPSELAPNNQHHPENNPTGFPNPMDRTLLCRAFLLLRTGETTGCGRYSRTFKTKTLPRKFKVALGCAFSKCPGYRSMGNSVMSLGAPGMLLVSKALISLLVEDMHTHRAATYDTRLTRCINLLLRHSTLLIGWLQYEAFIASKEEELMRTLTPTVRGTPSGARGSPPGARQARTAKGKGKAKGRGKGNTKGGRDGRDNSRDSSRDNSRDGRVGSQPRPRVVPQTPLASTSTAPAATPYTPVHSRSTGREAFIAWATQERARSRAGRGPDDRRDRRGDDRSATSRRS